MSERREKKAPTKRETKSQMKAKMLDSLLFIPNLMRLLVALLRDARVSSADKAILAGTIIYVIAPIDIIPDFIPFIGLVDDSYLIAISTLRLLNRAEAGVVREHWRGDHDVKELVTNISRVAEFFLPKRIKNVLRGRIDPKSNLSLVEKKRAANQ
ncbi:MAG TPA: YkvA family protein [Blastocatellia bacterium]|nr:YkvA family protein [Blastocatellia bacterium]